MADILFRMEPAARSRPAPFCALILKRYRTWRRYRATLASLSKLDDHMLADIAVAPGEIDAVARRAATEAGIR